MSPPPSDAHVIEAPVSTSESARPAKPAGARRIQTGPLVVGGLSVAWLTLIVLIPLAAVVVRSFEGGVGEFWDAVTNPQAVAAMRFTLIVSIVVAAIDAVMGVLIAWVLVRDEFRGKALVNGLIDLPFALPTIVAGLTLLALYGNKSPVGINVAYTQAGVALALLFVTLPFVVRAVQPVLIEPRPRGRGRPPPRSAPGRSTRSGGSSCPRCGRRSSPASRSRSAARSASSARSC